MKKHFKKLKNVIYVIKEIIEISQENTEDQLIKNAI